MKKRFGAAAIVLLCAVCASVPVLVYGWDMKYPQYFPKGSVQGEMYFEAGTVFAGTVKFTTSGYKPFVGVQLENDLWDAGYAAWGYGPDEVLNIIHPDPNVNSAVITWMKQYGIRFAITPFSASYSGSYMHFVVIRANSNGTYSTLYYEGGR
jgi:hypothetical protein